MNLTELAYADASLVNGITYYYIVTATNSFGESVDSIEASAHPVSTTSLPIDFALNAGQMQLNWPTDHLGWRLEMQTNVPGAGLGTNWVAIPNSDATNQIVMPIHPEDGSVFFRLVYP